MKRTGSAAKSSKSNGSSTKAQPKPQPRLVDVALCLRADGDSDVVPRKMYRLLADEKANSEGYVRVVDESGEDYLYPASYFSIVSVSAAVAKSLF